MNSKTNQLMIYNVIFNRNGIRHTFCLKSSSEESAILFAKARFGNHIEILECKTSYDN